MGYGIMEIRSKNWWGRNEKEIINPEIPNNKTTFFGKNRTYYRGKIALILQKNTQWSNALHPPINGHQSMRKHPAPSLLMPQFYKNLRCLLTAQKIPHRETGKNKCRLQGLNFELEVEFCSLAWASELGNSYEPLRSLILEILFNFSFLTIS